MKDCFDQTGRPAHRSASKGHQRPSRRNQSPPAQGRPIDQHNGQQSKADNASDQMPGHSMALEHSSTFYLSSSASTYAALQRRGRAACRAIEREDDRPLRQDVPEQCHPEKGSAAVPSAETMIHPAERANLLLLDLPFVEVAAGFAYYQRYARCVFDEAQLNEF